MRCCLTGLAAVLGSGVARGLVQANVQEWAKANNSEINRIIGHKAELLFTLQNDTKLADFRATMSDCEKWINSRIEAADKKRQRYNQ